jgi:hypothetical protein
MRMPFPILRGQPYRVLAVTMNAPLNTHRGQNPEASGLGVSTFGKKVQCEPKKFCYKLDGDLKSTVEFDVVNSRGKKAETFAT